MSQFGPMAMSSPFTTCVVTAGTPPSTFSLVCVGWAETTAATLIAAANAMGSPMDLEMDRDIVPRFLPPEARLTVGGDVPGGRHSICRKHQADRKILVGSRTQGSRLSL